MVEFAPTPVIIVKFKTDKNCEYLSGRYCRIADVRTARTCQSVCLIFLHFAFLCQPKRL